MKFRVIGAENETGNDVDIEISAADSKQAERMARDRGIMISSIESLKPAILESIALEPEHEAAAPAADPVATAVEAAPAAPPESEGTPLAPAGDAPAAPEHPEPAHEPAAAQDLHPGTHMEYKLLQNQALFLLEKAVNRYLNDGWEPTGGLTVVVINNAPNFFQAVMRRPKEE